MLNFTPDILEKEIVIIGDYDDETEEEKHYEKLFLEKLKNEIEVYGFKYHYIEEKTIEAIAEKLSAFDKDKIIIFNWFEKIYGKPDGENTGTQMVKFLEDNRYIFSGGDSHSFSITNDKYAIKEIFNRNKVPTPKGVLLTDINEENIKTINFPIIVKLATEHFSTGLSDNSIFNNPEDLLQYIKMLDIETKQRYFAEEFVDGEEYTLGVWGNNNPQALTVLKINYPEDLKGTKKILSFENKWETDSFYMSLEGVTEAKDLTDIEKQRIQQVAENAFKSLGVCGFARLDFRYKNGVPYCIDFNVNPYIGRDAEFLASSELSGYSLGDTYLEICRYGFEKFAQNKK